MTPYYFEVINNYGEGEQQGDKGIVMANSKEEAEQKLTPHYSYTTVVRVIVWDTIE